MWFWYINIQFFLGSCTVASLLLGRDVVAIDNSEVQLDGAFAHVCSLRTKSAEYRDEYNFWNFNYSVGTEVVRKLDNTKITEDEKKVLETEEEEEYEEDDDIPFGDVKENKEKVESSQELSKNKGRKIN